MSENVKKKEVDETKVISDLADAIITDCAGVEYSVFMNGLIQAMVKVTIQANPTLNVVNALSFIIVAIDKIRAAETVIKPNIILKG